MKRSHLEGVVLVATGLVVVVAAGCTGTDFLATGNSTVRFEIVLQGTTVGDYDCVIFEFERINVRPINGTCAADSANPGDQCFSSVDCLAGSGPGTCEGSDAEGLIPQDGIKVVTQEQTVPGNLTNGPCTPTAKKCFEPFFPYEPCVEDSDCDQETYPGNVCELQSPFSAKGEFVPIAPIVLSEGLYEINRLVAANIGLYADAGPVERSCYQADQFILDDALGDALRFTVQPGQDKVVQINMDLGELELAMPDQFGGCFGLQNALRSVFSCATCDAGVP